ncbi:hypothetical protein EMCG_05238 [[Emmonsia] crescens]|uniref:Uncharacterized protein n=1 Tax=[Emmonsia] crescens TaxID=73230 RepID=A0A0G2HPG3_9EURO|nr:hypothetical protein EMCG_05238 [Emmonsia crescens UAMH 3008]
MAVTRTSLIAALSLFALLNENFSVAEELPGWFNGYYIFPTNGSTAVESITCGGSQTTWKTSGAYANCCPTRLTTPCPFPTHCENATVTYDNGGGYLCPAGESCATMTIYETSPGGSPSATNIFCWKDWKANTIYRSLPQGATGNAPLTDNVQASPTITPPPETTSQPPNQPISDPKTSSPPMQEEPKSNRSLIIGATIGAIVGFTILGLAYFFYRRKQKKGGKGGKGGLLVAELDNSQVRAELQGLNVGGDGDGGGGAGAGEPKGQGYYGYATGTIPAGGNSNSNYVHELPGAMKDSTDADEYVDGPRENVTYEMPSNPS